MRSSINYHYALEKELERLKFGALRPKLLLHSCCAPCSSYVLECLRDYFDITVYFYNPNIYPEKEYSRRLTELEKFLKDFDKGSNIGFIHEEYSPLEFAACAKGYEEEKEGTERCSKCFDLRLSKTAGKAKELSFDYFATTLTVSPHKNAEMINSTGISLSETYGIKYLVSDFKKKNGFKRTIELSAEYGLYRQNYCGCEFSL